ncbi:5709_t:CDS:2, partial [Funneliformis mosseae]
HENEVHDLIVSEFNKLNVSDKNCSYCDKPFAEKLWCKECDPRCMIEGWTSGNSEIDNFIKDAMYDSRHDIYSEQDDESWKKSDPEPMKVALKRLNGSWDMSAKYFSELKAHWDICQDEFKDTKEYGYYGKEIKEAFEEADKEIPNISLSRNNNPDAIYTSRAFKFKNLTKPINSSLITSYLEKDENNEDSQLIELEIPN